MYTYNDRIWDYELTTGSWFAAMLISVLQIIVWWRLFEKAGEPGWKSIIPFYNLWTIFKIANSYGSTIGWFIASLIPGINAIVLLIMHWKFASRYTDSFGLKLLYFFFPFIGGLIFAFSDDFQYTPEAVFYR